MAEKNNTELAEHKALPESGEPELAVEKVVKKKEINGPKGLEPTRYGDWESKGRCYDF